MTCYHQAIIDALILHRFTVRVTVNGGYAIINQDYIGLYLGWFIVASWWAGLLLRVAATIHMLDFFIVSNSQSNSQSTKLNIPWPLGAARCALPDCAAAGWGESWYWPKTTLPKASVEDPCAWCVWLWFKTLPPNYPEPSNSFTIWWTSSPRWTMGFEP